ncbi:MAG: protein-L-isoaspartate(D-aspartate) O-methyltransferase [Verrucomicrobia bacterium]|nr:protein-L-isoaspartate(D-aspartate) O-methyltransferase [Verrucomicrobiota bacterium]
MAVPKFSTEKPPKVGVESRREPERATERLEMVASQIEARGVRNPRVLEAMHQVERHRFVLPDDLALAYRDGPLPIGQGQTISQPYIVAFMTEAIEPQPSDRVLEIGTGSGYQTATLAELVAEVYTMENIARLAKRAETILNQSGYNNIQLRLGDGHRGWPEAAPFDKIIVTAAPAKLPKALLDQLKPGGRMIVPVGRWRQELVRIHHTPDGCRQERLMPVRFVPMVRRLNLD